MNDNKKQTQVRFLMIPMARFPRSPTGKKVSPGPTKMYQGKAKNGPVTARKAAQ